MADWNEINNTFSSRLNTNWIETPIAWDNVPYTPSEGAEWIRGTVIPFPSENTALGKATVNKGLFVIQIFTPLNGGSGRAYELVDMLSAIFANQQFSDIICYAAETQRIGDDENGWYQLNLNINFWSYERN